MNFKSRITILLQVFCLVAVAAVSMLPEAALAVPAFARQTGKACVACHFQHYPALTPYGRTFKQEAFTEVQKGQSMIEADALSIPFVLNASLITKVRYQKTNGSTSETDKGEFQFPDEAALLIGGRAGANTGFLLEFATFGEADTDNGDFSLFASYKVHFNYPSQGTNYGAVLFSTDSLGAAYGFELLNTGAQRSQRVAEDRRATSAQQFVGMGSGEAEGVALVASRREGFVNLSFWTPDHGSVAVDGFAHYLRAALTPKFGEWDAGFGVQYFGGQASRSVASGGDVDTKGLALDAQLQGRVGSMPLGVYFTHAKADPSATNIFNKGGARDKKAWSILGELGILPNKMTLMLGYLDGDNGKATKYEDKRVMVGATWMLAQNMELQLWNTRSSGSAYDPKPASNGDNLVSLMLFVGF